MDALNSWWFIKAIMLFYLIAPVLKYVLVRWRGKGFWCILALDLLILACYQFTTHNVRALQFVFFDRTLIMECATRLPAFTLGMAMVLLPEKGGLIVGGRFRKYTLLPLLLLAMGIRVLTAGKATGVLPDWMHLNRELGIWLFYSQRILFCFITPAICLILSRIPFRPSFLIKPIALCGAISLELYLLHELIFRRAFSLFYWIPENAYQGYLLLLGTMVLSLASACLLHKLCAPFSKIGRKKAPARAAE